MESKNQIIWLLNGSEVGRADLPEHTTGEERLELAFKAGVKEYNNFLFTDKDGIIRAEANSAVMFKDFPLGIKSGKDYEEYLKSKQDGHSKGQ